MDLITKLNSVNKTVPLMKLCDIEVDKLYQITNVDTKNTKLGYKTFLELNNEFKIILPDRYAKMIGWDDCTTMIGWNIVYKGMIDRSDKKVHILEFRQQ